VGGGARGGGVKVSSLVERGKEERESRDFEWAEKGEDMKGLLLLALGGK
jgi:hypothetical protein